MTGKKRAIVALIGVLSLLAVPMVAVADEGEGSGGSGSEQAGTTLIEYVYNTVLHVLVYGFNDPEAPDPLNCTLPKGVTVEIDDEGQVVVSGGDLPEGCSALNAEGPNGQVNHGTFVSALVHAIRANFDGDTPFGHYLRGFARSDLGKGDDHVKGSDGTEEPELGEFTDGSKPGHGKDHVKGSDGAEEPELGETTDGSKPGNGKGKGRNRP
ncbi:MAG: hypothetical protein MUQ27_14745 [Acidimicrobiia bacterium]|nr:hypothetical protein [Acidimicrobiia bacterium]